MSCDEVFSSDIYGEICGLKPRISPVFTLTPPFPLTAAGGPRASKFKHSTFAADGEQKNVRDFCSNSDWQPLTSASMWPRQDGWFRVTFQTRSKRGKQLPVVVTHKWWINMQKYVSNQNGCFTSGSPLCTSPLWLSRVILQLSKAPQPRWDL